MTSLEGKVVVVVGASSGIGEGIARCLAGEKVKLVMAARRTDQLEAIIRDIKNNTSTCKATVMVPMMLDVTQRQKVLDFYTAIANNPELGPVDIAINCAGCMYFTMMKSGHWDEWEQQVDVNCKGVMNSCGAALPYMLNRKSGHIVNISSDAARQTFPALTVYNASKAFVHEFSKGLRCECVGTGVRVSELQPGDVRTDLIMKNTDKEAAEKLGVAIGEKIGGDGAFDQNSVLNTQDIADAVKYALTAPPHVGVNEILIEPRDQMFGDPTSLNQ